MTSPESLSCADFDAQLRDYLAGALSATEARRVEAHASVCNLCEARLEQATRRDVVYEPTLPAHVREATLRAIAPRPVLHRDTPHEAQVAPTSTDVHAGPLATQGHGAARTPHGVPAVTSRLRWAGGVLLAVAATVLVFITQRQDPSSAPGASGPVSTVAADTPRAVDPAMTAMQAVASFAEAEARPEFVALDAAARELEAALAAAPGDRELRAFLTAVRSRRDELSRRVKEATS